MDDENNNWQQPEIKNRELNKYNWLVLHKENLKLSRNTDIGAFSLLDASESISIGENVKIGSHCSLYSRTDIDNKKGKIILEKNSSLGSHCVVMPGITIGENSIVGAMSFVNKDIPANEVWIGSPAKFLKKIMNNNNGGEIKKTNQWKIPLFKTEWSEDNVEAVNKVIRRGTHWAAGPEIEEFEKKLAEFNGVKYALTFNSGTSALFAMYKAIGVEGKEVIVPSFTFIATANAIILAGGIPIFAESEEETLGLDAEDVERKITANTKAIVALHYAGGVSKDIEKLKEIANKHNIHLLEDNAHSLGVRKNGKLCGTFGIASILSFCQNKLITTGEGGAVITDSQHLYEKMKLIRSHGRVDNGQDYFSTTDEMEYLEVGHNFRMSSMNAALGSSQLNHFNEIMQSRISSASYLNQKLSEFKDIEVPKPYLNSNHFYQMYTIKLKNKENRDKLQKHLTENKIMSRIYYSPIHLTKFYQKKKCKKGELPKTEEISNRILTLPMYPGIPKEELDLIINSIKEFMQRGREDA
jgi:perosamine synthetase